MTDERMTQGDVRLREEERELLGAALSGAVNYESLDAALSTPDFNVAARLLAATPADGGITEAVERIVAARVGEVVDCSRCEKPSCALGKPEDLPICEDCAIGIGKMLGSRAVGDGRTGGEGA